MAKKLSDYKGYSCIYEEYTDRYRNRGFMFRVYLSGYKYTLVSKGVVGCNEYHLQEYFINHINNNFLTALGEPTVIANSTKLSDSFEGFSDLHRRRL